jgi:hypothetical protein
MTLQDPRVTKNHTIKDTMSFEYPTIYQDALPGRDGAAHCANAFNKLMLDECQDSKNQPLKTENLRDAAPKGFLNVHQ